MKITLNMGQGQNQAPGGAAGALRAALAAAKTGDWKDKQQLSKLFVPLITSVAEKRASDIPTINALIELGTEGLQEAAQKYGKTDPPDKFQLFAIDYIEKAMDRLNKKEGLFARLFKRS